MLSSSSRRAYLCRRCAVQARPLLQSPVRSTAVRVGPLQARHVTTQQQNDEGTKPSSKASGTLGYHAKLPMREQLRSWEPEKPFKLQTLMADSAFDGKVTNRSTKAQSTGSSELDIFRSNPDSMLGDAGEYGVETEEPEVASVGSATRKPGDLVEMRHSVSRMPILGVYLGYMCSRHHFYTSNGKWAISMGFHSIFSVSNFASHEEIAPIIAAIPKAAGPDELEALRMDDQGPSRDVGAGLIQKMMEFSEETDNFYHLNLVRLEKARQILSDMKDTRYMSLFEIARSLLPNKGNPEGPLPPHVLYAVHTALYRSEFTFQPVSPSPDSHRKDHLFEVFPWANILLINRVTTWVRSYIATKGASSSSKKLTPFDMFLREAREQVSDSRAKREWTPFGVLAPTSGVALKTRTWSGGSQDIIQFLEWWACYDLFDSGSKYHAYGSNILRALALYGGDVSLDQATAWTFLQEIGRIPPWEVPSRYKIRFPDTKIVPGGGLSRQDVEKPEDSLRSDIAAGARREWAEETVFCIDGPSTIVVDDGVSLERTAKPDEFWVHVHAADPASKMLPSSELCRFMELVPENIYLPGHFSAMLPANMGMDSNADYQSERLVSSHSLAADRPTLTFSAKVNAAGELLDYKVEAGTIRKVAYLDPEDVAKFCNEPAAPASPQKDSLVVGSPVESPDKAPNRPMRSPEDLDGGAQEDLKTLGQLTAALHQKRMSNGAWPHFVQGPSVDVRFEAPPADAASATKEAGNIRQVPADPSIKIGYNNFGGSRLVTESMLLAGVVAARWCSDRAIPIPYRRDVMSGDRSAAARDYAATNIYPLLEKGLEPSAAQRQEIMRLTGGVEVASSPGPYFMLGLDMYAKATSPLRRFSDLIVHWQIHAALAQERILGRPLDASTDDLDATLPFTSAELSEMLSLLQMRERMARTLSRGTKDWIFMALVRAWKFDKTLPRTLRFTVTSRWRQGLLGRLDLFNLDAVLNVEGLGGRVMIKDVRVGDQFEVELTDVNAHSRNILVKAEKYLGSGKEAQAQAPPS